MYWHMTCTKKRNFLSLRLNCDVSTHHKTLIYENKLAFVHECNTMDINYLDGTRHDTGIKTAKLLFTNNKSMSFFYKTN